MKKQSLKLKFKALLILSMIEVSHVFAVAPFLGTTTYTKFNETFGMDLTNTLTWIGTYLMKMLAGMVFYTLNSLKYYVIALIVFGAILSLVVMAFRAFYKKP